MTGTHASPGERLRRRLVERDPPTTHDRLGRPIAGPCLIWQGALDGGGYGNIRVSGRTVHTHRLAYLLETGVDTLDRVVKLDHLCRVRACSQPYHLEPTTQAENVARGDTGLHNRVKTHCPKRHPYDEANTYVNPRGRRVCRKCMRDASRMYEARTPARAKRTRARTGKGCHTPPST
jgi:hypothetical protein